MLMSPQRDRLYDLCRQFREKKTFKRRRVPVHEVPTDPQNIAAEFYSCQKFEFFTVDSAYCVSSKNSFVSFISSRKKCFGQVRVFYSLDKQDFVSMYVFDVIKSFKPPQSSSEICSFYEVKKSRNILNIPQDSVSEKILPIQLDEKLFFVPLLTIFEHD